MHYSVISVTFRKQVSDGNYGSELAEVTLTGAVEETEQVDGHLTSARLLESARASVHAELLRSPSTLVRRAVEQEQPRPAPAPVTAASPSDSSLEDLPF